MIQIRPVSDLRNKYSELESFVKEGSPVYLTKNGYGSMVLLSLEQYSDLIDGIELKLDAADREAMYSDKRLSHEEVFTNIRGKINGRE